MSVINNTAYFLGPLYTNKLYSFSTITIINDNNFVGIITGNVSCKNIYVNNIGVIDISSNTATTTLSSPINYTTNFSVSTNVTYAGLGVSTIVNMSNTLGYINHIKNEFNVNASFPIMAGQAFPLTNLNYNFNTASPLEMAGIIIKEPGRYLLYIMLAIGTYTSDANYTLGYMYTQIRVNDVTQIQKTEMVDALLYGGSGGGNAYYVYNDSFMCDITSTNSKLSFLLNTNLANTFYCFITDGNSQILKFKYFTIKIT